MKVFHEVGWRAYFTVRHKRSTKILSKARPYHYKLASLFANHILFESLHMAGVDVEIKEHTKPKKDKNNFTEFMMHWK
jgi:hypothetical protein